jgi:adenosine deaminase
MSVLYDPSKSWRDYFPYWDIPLLVAAPLASVLGKGPRDAEELAFAQAVESLPKIELHVHMEAAVPASYYAQLNDVRRLFSGGDLPSQRSPFPNFGEFIRAWMDHTRLISHEDAFAEMAKSFVALRAKQRITYSEAHISPFDFTLGRVRYSIFPVLDFATALRAYLRGLRAGLLLHPEVEVRLIVDLLWISTDEQCDHMMGAIEEVLKDPALACPRSGRPLIIALGLGGFEKTEKAAQKRALFQRYPSLGLKLDIHSGETTTAREYATAMDILCPDRIGHGIAPIARPAPGVDFFQGGIGTCPSSNVLTGAFPGSMEQHPLKVMLERGIPVSVNTDDPLLFGTTLTLEYVMLRRALGLDLQEVRGLLTGAADLAFDKALARRALSEIF